MKNKIFNAVAVLVSVVAFAAVLVPHFISSSASSNAIAATRASFDESLSRLLQGEQAMRERDHEAANTLADHTARLERIEQAIEEQEVEEQAEGPVVEPPSLVIPAAKTEPEGYTQGLAILSAYNGKPWFQRESRGNKQRLIEHLAEHGFPTEGLERFTNGELERIHGAIHTQHESARGYAAQPLRRSPRVSGPSRVLRDTPKYVAPTGRPMYMAPAGRPTRVRNCPGGRCPTSWSRS